MQSSSRSSFSLRGWAHAQPLVRVLVPVRTRVKCIVVRGESTDLTRPVSILTVVGEGSSSPLKNTPWEEVMQHTVSDYSSYLFGEGNLQNYPPSLVLF